MNAKTKALGILALCLSFTTLANAQEGKAGSGGGSNTPITEKSIRQLIEGNGLKLAMMNYLKTIKVSEISDPTVQNILSQLMMSSSLLTDLQNSVYTDRNGNNTPCLSESGENGFASTPFGLHNQPSIGSPVCFEIEKIAKDYEQKGLSSEQGMIELAALAIHEHIHHFQADPLEGIDPALYPQVIASAQYQQTRAQLEDQANAVGAYLRNTAKILQVAVLKWDPAASSSKVAEYKIKVGEQVVADVVPKTLWGHVGDFVTGKTQFIGEVTGISTSGLIRVYNPRGYSEILEENNIGLMRKGTCNSLGVCVGDLAVWKGNHNKVIAVFPNDTRIGLDIERGFGEGVQVMNSKDKMFQFFRPGQ